MNTQGRILCGAAMLWATAIGTAHAAPTAGATDTNDPKRINACMAMSAEAVTQNDECSELMKTKNITVADMETMKTCKSMKPGTMAQDETCGAMADKHPDMMRPAQQ